ncbi:nuclear GTPase SLIP-GC-like [Odontesthes bonariensis]
MDDFVREKLIQWGLSEWMETFKEQDIDKESLYCLNDRDIDDLIPKVGPRARFKKKLEELKQEEQNADQDTQGSSSQLQDETNDMTEVGPSPGDKDEIHRKRKSDHQGETSEWQTPTKWPCDSKSRSIEEAVILSKVKVAMENVKAKIHGRDNTELNDFLKTIIIDLETDKRELVGVFGKTGAGKSSLINAVIGEKNLLPSGSVSACTSVMIKVEANMHNMKYVAEIEFITKEEWRDELWSMFQFLGDKADQEKEKDEDEDDDDDDRDRDEYHDIVEKLSALYGEEWKQKNCETYKDLMDKKYFREIPENRQSRKKSLTCESAQELSAKLVKYTKNEEGKEVKKWFWPLVKCVTIRVPRNHLLQHVTIVDLPGNGDRNKSRDKMWKGIVGDCSTVWIVTDINRAAADKESWEILKSAASLLGNGGECQRIHFICTKSDLVEDLHEKTDAKDQVRKEFNKLTRMKKHFGDDCFEVFTVSAKEFLKRKHLKPDDTEIPKLQEFLQKLNNRHSETLNYVSGARAILRLIQAARLRETVGNETEVCEELERNMTYHLFPVKKAMEDAFQTFDRCLSEGVENSKSSCEGNLKSFLYPRKTGRGFHRTLKCVVKNNGSYKPKKGKEINFNRKLTSSLTDSIDEEFRKTFPNEGKCGAFNGVISTFSLGTKELIQKYKDVELQLIFLKTEEDKMKTKLSRLIRDRKKTIYSSLLKTIEKIMQECYEKAAEFKGKDSLQNMRDTIVRHVYESKNSMFDRAKTVMLNELKELTDEIVETLEKTMTKSIELSLKTDYKSIPDVSAELTMVQKLYDELRSISDEEMS